MVPCPTCAFSTPLAVVDSCVIVQLLALPTLGVCGQLAHTALRCCRQIRDAPTFRSSNHWCPLAPYKPSSVPAVSLCSNFSLLQPVVAVGSASPSLFADSCVRAPNFSLHPALWAVPTVARVSDFSLRQPFIVAGSCAVLQPFSSSSPWLVPPVARLSNFCVGIGQGRPR